MHGIVSGEGFIGEGEQDRYIAIERTLAQIILDRGPKASYSHKNPISVGLVATCAVGAGLVRPARNGAGILGMSLRYTIYV